MKNTHILTNMIMKEMDMKHALKFMAVLLAVLCFSSCKQQTGTAYIREDLRIVLPANTDYKETAFETGSGETVILSDDTLNSTIHFNSFEHINEKQFETDEEEFRYICELTEKSNTVIHYTKILEKKDRYVYRIEPVENSYEADNTTVRYGGIYRKNNKYHSVLVYIPREKQEEYETEIINMLKEAE